MGRQSLNSKFLCRMYPHLMIPSSNYWTNRIHIEWEITPSLFNFPIFEFPAHLSFRGWWHPITLKHRTTILISSACNIINDYSKLFIVAIPNKTIKILPYLVTRAKSPLLVHISRSIDAFATAKQPYESSWSVQSPETIGKCSFTFSRA